MLHNKQPQILSGLTNKSVLLAHAACPVWIDRGLCSSYFLQADGGFMA